MADRTAQKTRTRKALLDAARKMMAEGAEITVARVADATGISRATAYRYYSDPVALSAEATLDIALKPTDDLLEGIFEVRARVHAVAGYYLHFIRDHEAEFRQFLALTMRQWAARSHRQMRAELRGGRRMRAFAEALAPVRSVMAPSDFDDLVARLSMLTGLEQHIVLADVLRVQDAEADRLQRGLVDAVLDRYLPSSA